METGTWSIIFIIAAFDRMVKTPTSASSDRMINTQAMIVRETGRFSTFSIFSSPGALTKLPCRAAVTSATWSGMGSGFSASPLSWSAGAGQQLRFALAADALGDLVGVVGARRVATAVGKAEVLDRFVAAVARQDVLDRRPLVVSARQVEADRPTAAPAAVAVALAQHGDAL